MNIDKVYVCDIYRLDDISYNCYDSKIKFDGYNLDKFLGIKRDISYVKKVLVYFSINKGGFIDLETNECYRLGYPSTIGELFVDIHKSKINGRTLMGNNKKYILKKKVLKRYNQYKLGDNNECK